MEFFFSKMTVAEIVADLQAVIKSTSMPVTVKISTKDMKIRDVKIALYGLPNDVGRGSWPQAHSQHSRHRHYA